MGAEECSLGSVDAGGEVAHRVPRQVRDEAGELFARPRRVRALDALLELLGAQPTRREVPAQAAGGLLALGVGGTHGTRR